MRAAAKGLEDQPPRERLQKPAPCPWVKAKASEGFTSLQQKVPLEEEEGGLGRRKASSLAAKIPRSAAIPHIHTEIQDSILEDARRYGTDGPGSAAAWTRAQGGMRSSPQGLAFPSGALLSPFVPFTTAQPTRHAYL